MRDRRVAGSALPAVNQHLLVRTPWCAQPRPSRVEDARDRTVVVSWPAGADGAPLHGATGDEVLLHWTSEWGLHSAGGVLVVTVRAPLACWVVDVRAVDRVRQRREAYRLEVRLPLVLSAGPDRCVEGTVVDLSEGGLGFRVPAEGPLELGARLRAAFALDGEEVTAGVRVVRLDEPAGGARVGGARFEPADDDLATRLRRYVLQEQIRRRGVARG